MPNRVNALAPCSYMEIFIVIMGNFSLGCGENKSLEVTKNLKKICTQ